MHNYRELYRAEQLPAFQNRMYFSREDARHCVKGDVVLVQDLETGLIFNNAFRPELMQYDENYQNEQAVSLVFQDHLSEVSEIVAKHFQDLSLIEIGCGKGYFLEKLKAMGFKITGFDPAYEGTNKDIIKEYFTPAAHLHRDGIILRHVLEHVQDPVTFLMNIRDSNNGSGKIYIEVPCFDWICRHRAWFDIFYEHANYFRIDDFKRMFGTIYESGHFFGGQYLYVVANISTVRIPVRDPSHSFDFPEDFLDMVYRCADRIKSRSRRNDTGIWGGASKGVIFALYMQRSDADIHTVIDINPEKQGKYLAATGLKVYSPEQAFPQLVPGSDLFVMNSNYLPEIKELTGNRLNYLLVDNEPV